MIVERRAWVKQTLQNFIILRQENTEKCPPGWLYLCIPLFLVPLFVIIAKLGKCLPRDRISEKPTSDEYESRSTLPNIRVASRPLAGSAVRLLSSKGSVIYQGTTDNKGQVFIPWARGLARIPSKRLGKLRLCHGDKCARPYFNRTRYIIARTAFLRRRPKLSVVIPGKAMLIRGGIAALLDVRVKNKGPAIAMNVQVQATLPLSISTNENVKLLSGITNSNDAVAYWKPSRSTYTVGNIRPGATKTASVIFKRNPSAAGKLGPIRYIEIGAMDSIYRTKPDRLVPVALDQSARLIRRTGDPNSVRLGPTEAKRAELDGSNGEPEKQFIVTCSAYQTVTVDIATASGPSVRMRTTGSVAQRTTVSSDRKQASFRCGPNEQATFVVYSNSAQRSKFAIGTKSKPYVTRGVIRKVSSDYELNKGTKDLVYYGRAGTAFYRGFRVGSFSVTESTADSAKIRFIRRFSRLRRRMTFVMR